MCRDPRKLLAVSLVAVMLATLFQIPVHVIPSILVFNIQKTDKEISANINVEDRHFFAIAKLEKNNATLLGIYDVGTGIVQDRPWCAVEMVPPGTGEQPLRIPECGTSPFWYWWTEYCNTHPNSSECNPQNYIEWNVHLNSTPYTSNGVPSIHMHLEPNTALNVELTLGSIAFLCAVATILIVNPATFMATVVSGVMAWSYGTLYATDKNTDGSFDSYTPYDPTNWGYALLGIGAFYLATPHVWWKMYFSGSLPFRVSGR